MRSDSNFNGLSNRAFSQDFLFIEVSHLLNFIGYKVNKVLRTKGEAAKLSDEVKYVSSVNMMAISP